MYETDHPAYKKLGQIGKEITTKVKPRAVVVFSAHWQAGRDSIQVNTAENTDLIYEYVLFLFTYSSPMVRGVDKGEILTFPQLLRFPEPLLQGEVP
jgi:hypothetical protein